MIMSRDGDLLGIVDGLLLRRGDITTLPFVISLAEQRVAISLH